MKKITNPSDTVLIDPNEPLILPDGTALVGRIEWFLYALCCLDYQNLPTPMSRIEEFANALITGEIPNIEPQSRAEQFFLAILDGNVSDLPQPQSRSEVLLDKLARGEFDLSDVEPIQSRYELLLAYLIKNGGIGNIDYVLYEFSEKMKTMYNTVEKPFKSLELSGNTLVNCVLEDTENDDYTSFDKDYSGTSFTINGTSEGAIKSAILKGQTKYKNIDGQFYDDLNIFQSCLKLVGKNIDSGGGIYDSGVRNTVDFVAINEDSKVKLSGLTLKNLVFYDGDKTLISVVGVNTTEEYVLNIPVGARFFRFSYDNTVDLAEASITISTLTIQSVKLPVLTTTGKNLMDINSRDVNSINYHGVTYSIDANGYYSIKGTLTSGGRWVNTFDLTKSATWGNSTIITEDFMLKKGTYTLSACDISGETSTPFRFIRLYKKPFTSVAELHNRTSTTFTLNEDTKLSMMFQTVNYNSGDSIDVKFKVQIEEGTQATPYEPFKSNILSTSEDVELRGIGDVQDTLDLMTGELTQRIGEVTFDGSENWSKHTISTDEYFVGIIWSPMADVKGGSNTVSDKLTHKFSTNDDSVIYFSAQYPLITFHKDSLESMSIESFKKKLSELSPTVQYQLAQESVKTVDLNVVDQNNTKIDKIHVFDEVTHVNATSDELTPTVNIGKSVSYPTIIKPNTKYTVDLKRNDKPLTVNLGGTEVTFASGETRKVITTPSTLTNDKLSYYGIGAKCSEIMLIEGEIERNIDYFTGMQSVVMQNQMPILCTTGKNLIPSPLIANTGLTWIDGIEYNPSSDYAHTSTGFIKIQTGVYYTSSNANNFQKRVHCYDKNKMYLGVLKSDGSIINNANYVNLENTFKIDNENVYYIRLTFYGVLETAQLEQSSTSTSYEPHKTSILSCNDDVTLRGIGDVRDTLDCLTGEVVERIGEIVLDGGEDEVWARNISLSNDNYSTSLFTLNVKGIKRELNNCLSKKCDKFPVNPDYSHSNDIEGIHQIIDNQIAIRVLKTKLSEDSAEGFNSWLSNNPLTVQYKLLTESVKTVDLNVVDQDGNTIPKVKSHNGTTHLEVTVPKQSLLPNVSAEVATDNSKDMSSLTVKHQEISETQSAIEDNIQSQSDEIDTALMATTEIFESILE